MLEKTLKSLLDSKEIKPVNPKGNQSWLIIRRTGEESGLGCKYLCCLWGNAVLFEGRLQFSSVAQSCPTLCDPMNHSTPGLPFHHQLPELSQTYVRWVSDSIQPSHLLLSPSPRTFNLSQHQGLFQWVGCLHQVAKVLEFQHQAFRWVFRIDFL